MYLPRNATVALSALAARAFIDGHPFVAPGSDDSRSPCPAVNTLANHGYIKHSGKGIGYSELKKALNDVYHLADDLALVLTTSQFTTGINFNNLDLHQLAKHNRIEHDGSLVHDDANGAEFAPTETNQTKVEEIISANPDGLTYESLATVRKQRNDALTAAGNSLDMLHAEVAASEVGLPLLVIGQNDVISVDRFRTFYGDNKLPDDFEPPTDEVTLKKASAMTSKVKDYMATLD